ncbi:MAG: sigma 54-interacting transcriptional regulator [Calditrichia bacterium]
MSWKNALLERNKFYRITGKSPQILQSVFELVNYLADVDSTVLIRGESGTGKEMVARAIHQSFGSKKRAVYFKLCGDSGNIVGKRVVRLCEKAHLPGANTHRVGRFEAADGGTLFLDEIGDMPPQIQAKLLRVIQEKTIERLAKIEKLKWMSGF